MRQLIQRHELAELSDDDFKRLKRQVLLGNVPEALVRPAQIELLVASHSDVTRFDATLHKLTTSRKDQRPRTIDAALVSRHDSGAIHIREIAELTRPLVRGSISIISATCGLLFPLESLLPQHAGTPPAASFGAIVTSEEEQLDLISIGNTIQPGTTSIVAVYWYSRADAVTSSLRDFDRVTRHVLGEDVTSQIASLLVENTDARVS
jgi:hypothetical protein